MLDNKYRGLSSGFSGRDVLWKMSWQMFLDSPLVGHGLGYFSHIGFVGSHNIILYSLASGGLFGILPLFIIFIQMWNFVKRDLFNFFILLSILPLFLFNDRFININPYPFVFYLILLLWRRPTNQYKGHSKSYCYPHKYLRKAF